ncbi:MAG: hypothetical protein B6D63_06535 [Candidatus Latescibacteria bacterium 4484_7]|nr:MAG: hypothetical protein B6D63_06535 [Candidatus Latescibacteria bacterium 4484_7]
MPGRVLNLNSVSTNRLGGLDRRGRIITAIAFATRYGLETTKAFIAKLLGTSRPTLHRWLEENGLDFEKLREMTKSHFKGKSPQIGDTDAILAPYSRTVWDAHMASMVKCKGCFIEVGLLDRVVELPINQVMVGSIGLSIFGRDYRAINPALVPIRSVMVVCFYHALKKHGYIHPLKGWEKGMVYADSVFGVFEQIVNKGTVHNRNPHLRHLERYDKKYSFIKLFERYGNYKPAHHSYSYRTTDELERIASSAIELFLKLEFVEPSPRTSSDFYLWESKLSVVPKRDLLYMLSRMNGRDDMGFWIEERVMDEQMSRKYSLFTSIKSVTRRMLGYTAYDMSSALQSIVLGIIDPDGTKYPWHWMMVKNKKRLRRHFAKRFDKDIDYVKERITAADNGERRKRLIGSSHIFKAYVMESEAMVDEFIAHFGKHNKTMLRKAKGFAKYDYEFVGYDENKKRIYKQSKHKDKYSIFFFLWTFIERDAREAMIESAREQGYQGPVMEVHDAIYTLETGVEYLSTDKMEWAVSRHTGLNIKIERTIGYSSATASEEEIMAA